MKNRKFKGILGLILLVAFIFGNNYLTDWNTAELVGYNIVSLIELIGGIYLVYASLKGKKENKN